MYIQLKEISFWYKVHEDTVENISENKNILLYG
jgi:hypothetical protein